ncbi:endolysin [Microbacterium phage Eden]|uniref:Endolysin n=1 Tax=Microbacterium phage Eden TaxID=2250289 RepID=A0A345KWB3_9CAUD|nr:endolysin [Microbacterium phage Eden]AXH47315.1 endolysin [Microbacterium phage Eden]
MANLKNHPEYWLRDDAAAAFNAFEDKYGVHKVNSAGRTVAEQNELIRLWYSPNRPSWLFRPAEPAETSNHVRNGGAALDMAAGSSIKNQMAEFGFQWLGAHDPVHYDFTGWSGAQGTDTVRNEQNFLNAARGERLVVDGIKGAATTAAYKRYQEFLRAYGYTGAIDGIWGGGTQAAHAKFYAEWDAKRNQSTKSPKSAGELNYADIQAALNKHGYGLAVDGIWGPKSSNALADFQRRNGLVVDRLVGPATWSKLNV